MLVRVIIRPILIVTAAIIIATLGAGTPDSQHSVASAADAPGVVRTTLANGLRVIVDRVAAAPVVQVNAVYLVGSADAPANDPSLNNAASLTLNHYVNGLNASQLSALNSELGGRSTLYSDVRTTRYVSEVAAADVPIILHVEADRMRGTSATNADWAVERAQFAQGAAMNEGSYNTAWHAHMLSALAPRSPLSHDPFSGATGIVRDPLAVAQRFISTWYVPSNAILIIAGDVDPDAVIAQVHADFDPLPRRPAPKQVDAGLTPPHGSTTTIVRAIVTHPAIACFDEPGSGSGDFAAAQILDDIIVSRSGSLRALQESGEALTTSVDQLHSDRDVTFACVQAVASLAQDSAKLLASLKDVLAQYADNGVTDDQVASAIHYEMLQRALDHTDVSRLADSWTTYVANLGYSSPDDYYDAIQKVTMQDVDRVARTSLDARMVAFATVQTPEQLQPPPTAAAPPSSTSVGSSTLPAWASAAGSAVVAVASQAVPAETTLPNGLRIITVDEPGTGVVQLFGRVKVDPQMAAPAGKDGIDLVLSRLFADGPADMTHDAFAKALDELGGSLDAGSDFDLSTTTGDFDRGLSLLADEELHPTFTATSFGLALDGAAQDALDRNRSLGAMVSSALARGMYPPGDPAGRMASPLTLATVTASDVQSYFNAAFRPERTTIVVIGDIEPSAAVASITKWFGGWTDGTTPAPPDDLPAVPQNKPVRQMIPQPTLGVRYVLLGETVDVTPTSPSYEALTTGVEALGGDTWDSRLAQDVRDKQGLVVNIQQIFQASSDRATVMVVYVCDPANAAKVRSIIGADIHAMQTQPLSNEALDRTRSRLIRRQVLQMSGPSGLAQEYLTDASLGLPLDEPALRAARYAALTPDEVMRALAAALRPNGFVDLEFGAP